MKRRLLAACALAGPYTSAGLVAFAALAAVAAAAEWGAETGVDARSFLFGMTVAAAGVWQYLRLSHSAATAVAERARAGRDRADAALTRWQVRRARLECERLRRDLERGF